MQTGLFNKLIYTARKIAFHLKEKQKMTIDNHVLEHMLFYHDLAGTNLEKNKASRIVKADVLEALGRQNIFELCLALKLPPKLWEEQLKSIVSELDSENKLLLGKLLIAPSKHNPNPDKNSIALNHADWRVRANAANILVFLDCKDAVTVLTQALKNDTSDDTISFCYIAYALGKLQGQEAKEALVQQLTNSDSWLRVDVAGALSYFPFSTVAQELSGALMKEEEALDYMAYAISLNIKPLVFLQSDNKQQIRGGCRLITGIIEASENSFTRELVADTETYLCLPYLVKIAQQQADAVVVDTALKLCQLTVRDADNLPIEERSASSQLLAQSKEQEAILKTIANSDSFKEIILEIVRNVKANENITRDAEFIHALNLIGLLDISEAQPDLVGLLTQSTLALSTGEIKTVILAISELSAHREQSAAELINYAESIIKIEERLYLDKNKQPVLEEDTNNANLYWQILKALGNLGNDKTVAFLVRILDDYAPDIRARALQSIIAIYGANTKIDLAISITQILQNALKDPSPIVQLAALSGVTQLNQIELLNEILPLIDLQENTVSKQALACLASLAKTNETNDLKILLEEKIKTIKEDYKRQRILEILQKC